MRRGSPRADGRKGIDGKTTTESIGSSYRVGFQFLAHITDLADPTQTTMVNYTSTNILKRSLVKPSAAKQKIMGAYQSDAVFFVL